MQIRHIVRIVFAIIISASFGYAAAGPLDAVLKQVGDAKWGAQELDVKSAVSAAVKAESPGVLITAGQVLSRQATVTYLFNKNGGLYNISWYALTPVSEMKTAQKLNDGLVSALRKKLGKPKYTFSDGNPNGFTSGMKHTEQLNEMLNKGKKPGDPELPTVHTVFHSKLAFWDGGKYWVFTNLLCSTDGKCYQHLQFVSKELTRDEKYAPTPHKAFSYSSLDRDQDLVTKRNEPMEAELLGK